MGYAARANEVDTVARRDGFSIKRDASGYALFVPRGTEVLKLRDIADSFGYSRHELGAPRFHANHDGMMIPICPRIQYTCCATKTIQWSDACEDGFGPTCPEHGGKIEFVYETVEPRAAN